MRPDIPDALEPLRESRDIVGPDRGDFSTNESAQAWAAIATTLALQSIAASLARMADQLETIDSRIPFVPFPRQRLTASEGSGTLPSRQPDVRPQPDGRASTSGTSVPQPSDAATGKDSREPGGTAVPREGDISQ